MYFSYEEVFFVFQNILVIFIYIDFVSVSCDVSSRFLNCSGSVVLLFFLILLKKQGAAAIQHANEREIFRFRTTWFNS
jgi:hypothetical protein